MGKERRLREGDLAALAKRFRERAGKTRAQAARDMDVSQASIFRAEENPEESLFKLRSRLIETYSSYKVVIQISLERKQHGQGGPRSE